MTTNTNRYVSLEESSADFRILSTLNELHLRHRNADFGQVAQYIPELAKVDPNLFSIAIVTTDGQTFAVGDSTHRFTLQSIANPFVYGYVLDALGRNAVLERVDVEPTGNPFNSIMLDQETHRPMNPMVNAGAIAVAGLMPGGDPTDRLNRMLEMFSRYLDATPTVDMEVFMSERTTGDRNRSIAYLMRNFGVLENGIDETLDLYFQQCATTVDCRQLALMAATLANGGVNPQTGRTAIGPQSLRDVLTIMFSCGLYESSGQWVHAVGIPAKSGVSGGLMAVVPGRMGIGIFSPALDDTGNSVRAKLVCLDLSQMLDLHVFEALSGKSR